MAHDLNLKRILCTPLSSQALSLIGFADRAIPLLSVNPVKRVALFTMRFSGVEVRDRSAVLHNVVVWSKQAKVLGIDACRITAVMVHHHPFRDFTMHHIPSYPMSASALAPEMESSIAILVQGTNPIPAALGAVLKFGSKAHKFISGKVHDLLLMGRKGTWCNRAGQHALV